MVILVRIMLFLAQAVAEAERLRAPLPFDNCAIVALGHGERGQQRSGSFVVSNLSATMPAQYVPGSPHVMAIELRAMLSYQDNHMLCPPS